MLLEMTASEFVELQVFDELEPTAEHRADWNTASIVQAFWQIALRKTDITLDQCRVKFGDSIAMLAGPTTPKQSVEYQQRMIDSWCYIATSLLTKGTPSA
jgi:hypothetical protein